MRVGCCAHVAMPHGFTVVGRPAISIDWQGRGRSLHRKIDLSRQKPIALPTASRGGPERANPCSLGRLHLFQLALRSRPGQRGRRLEEAAAGQDDFRARAFKADGGIMRANYQEGSKEPVAKKTMPLLDMGGKEMDLREEGGFVPIGRMEKADDVPARLSKNEFVFTADAVRNAGDGDVDKGAEVMYNMMKNLEAGGEVSEESQGLEGARRMFQTSQRLEEVL